MRTSKFTFVISFCVCLLAAEALFPEVMARAGEEVRPVIDGVNRVFAPRLEPNHNESELPPLDSTKQPDAPQDEDIEFWEPIGGRPE